MSSPITIYIPQFDQTTNVGEQGFMDYDPIPIPDFDRKIRVGVNINNLKMAFQYKSNSLDFEEETAFALYANQRNIVPFIADSSDNISTLYSIYTETDTNLPAPIDFLQELSQKVFNHRHMVDLFSNEDDVVTAFKEAVLQCGNNIEQISTSVVQLKDDQAGDKSTDVAGLFFDNMDLTHLNIDSNDSSTDAYREIYVDTDTNSGHLLKMEVTTEEGRIINTYVVRGGYNYADGDVITLSKLENDGTIDTTKYITLTLSAESLQYVNTNLVQSLATIGNEDPVHNNLPAGIYMVMGISSVISGGKELFCKVEIAEYDSNSHTDQTTKKNRIISVEPTSFNQNITTSTELIFTQYIDHTTDKGISFSITPDVFSINNVQGVNKGGLAAQTVLSGMLNKSIGRFNDTNLHNLNDSNQNLYNDDDTSDIDPTNTGFYKGWHSMPFIPGDTLVFLFNILSHPDQLDVDDKYVKLQRRILVEIIATEVADSNTNFVTV